jgi:hypothetical protein
MPEQKPHVDQLFPKWKYHRTGKSQIVNDADAEAALGEGWGDTPGGPSGLPPGSDPLRCFDEWNLEQLSAEAKARIKAELLEAHADVIERSREDTVREISMKKAFAVFAQEFLAAGCLTELMLRDSIPQNVHDAAVSGGWESGTRQANRRFTVRFGNHWVPAEVPNRLSKLFEAPVCRWRAKLSESRSTPSTDTTVTNQQAPAQMAPGEIPVQPSVTERPRGVRVMPRGRGFEADADRHNAIADIVEKWCPGWKMGSMAWRHTVLKSICLELDQGEIDTPRGWRTGRTASLNGIKLKGWAEAFELGYTKLITDAIRYSLRMVARTADKLGDSSERE